MREREIHSFKGNSNVLMRNRNLLKLILIEMIVQIKNLKILLQNQYIIKLKKRV